MVGDNQQEQLDEIEALRSMYDDDRISIIQDYPNLSGSISVELSPLPNPLRVSANVSGVSKSRNLSALSPVHLIFTLPAEYPNVAPLLEVECEWITSSLKDYIESTIGELCRENAGMPVLFFCCDSIQQEIGTFVGTTTEVILDDNPYATKYNISSHEVLRILDDSSEKALDLNFESCCFDCEVCFDNKMGRECVRFTPCSHVFCQQCVKAYFMERIRGLQIRPLECLSDACETPATQLCIRNILGEAEFERYERILLEQALGQMRDVVSCPRRSCQKPVVLSSITPNLGTCDVCGFSFCAICQRTFHGVDSCQFKPEDRISLIKQWDESDESERIAMSRRFGGMKALQKIIDVIQNEGWIEGNSRPCPRCRVDIEKNSGCNKMHCTNCDVSFCWLCNRVLDKKNPYDHFNSEGTAACNNRLFEGVIDDNANNDDDEFDGDIDDVDWRLQLNAALDDDSDADDDGFVLSDNEGDTD